MNKSEKFHRTLIEMTGKRNMQTNLSIVIENKETINSRTVIADTFNKKNMNFATTVGGPSTQAPNEVFNHIENNDEKVFAYPTNMIEVSKTVVNIKNNEASVIDGISVEVRKISFPVIDFILTETLNLFL